MAFWGRDRDGKSKAGSKGPTLEELSSSLLEVLNAVQAPIEKCARGHQLVEGWRELHVAVRTSVDRLNDLPGDGASPRLQRMARLTYGEVWEMAERWLPEHDPATPEDMALLWTLMWERAEAARAAYAQARGDQVAPARERLRRLVAQADAGVARLDEDVVSAGQLQVWRQAADELRQFVADVLARR